eukprot:6175805-Amphidinium_carterae.1
MPGVSAVRRSIAIAICTRAISSGFQEQLQNLHSTVATRSKNRKRWNEKPCNAKLFNIVRLLLSFLLSRVLCRGMLGGWGDSG